MKYLIDTNVLSELFRQQPDPQVLDWASRTGRVGLSVVTGEEVIFGLSWRPKPRLEERILQFIDEWCEILEITDAIARISARMRGDFQRRGITRDPFDSLIAATAIAHQLIVVTRNTNDFEGCGAALLNPFQVI